MSMKRIIILLVLTVGSIYGLGRFNLGESGARRFLSTMESLTNAGDFASICEMLHDDLEMNITDNAGDVRREIDGGKRELCAVVKASITGLKDLPHSMQVEYTDLRASQPLTKPWTSELSYAEHRTLSIPGVNVTLRTVSKDEITLVQTLTGVKLLKLKSQVFKADAV
jgi:hypothetical protein